MIGALKTKLWLQVVVAMGLGLAVGLLLSPSGAGLLAEETAESTGPWIALPGNLFLALIKMVVIPLVLSSIILGLTSTEDADFLKKASVRIFPYFVGTTVVAVGIGILLTLLIQPGKYIASEMIKDIMEGSPVIGAQTGSNGAHLAERLLGMIPTNYVKSVLD
jgi:Na+/H+-dicarboxylate symporter